MRLRPAHELLDDDEGTPAEIKRGLDDLWWINQHLGGVSSWRRLWTRFLARAPLPAEPLTLLDVGAGTGQVTAAHAAWLRQRGCTVTALALDRRLTHLRAPVPALAADANRLPFADASLDLVTCNLFLHHFHDQPGNPVASRLLQEMLRVARRGVLINDLERSWWPYLAIRAMSPGFSRLTRHDGPRSVAQAYTRRELEVLAGASGAARFEVLRLPRFRLGLIMWPLPPKPRYDAL